MGLDVFQDLVAFTFQQLSQLASLQVLLKFMCEIVMHISKESFNLTHQTQRI